MEQWQRRISIGRRSRGGKAVRYVSETGCSRRRQGGADATRAGGLPGGAQERGWAAEAAGRGGVQLELKQPVSGLEDGAAPRH